MKSRKPKAASQSSKAKRSHHKRINQKKVGHPEPGHGRYLWKSDKDFENFMRILDENSKR